MKRWGLPLGAVRARRSRGLPDPELGLAPSFDVPVVDAASYDSLARELAAGELSARLFYPGAFYPLFLALVYATGGSLLAAKAVQAGIGAATCALTAPIVASRPHCGSTRETRLRSRAEPAASARSGEASK